MKKIRNKLRYFDFYLFIPYVILCGIGVVMVYSASSISLSYNGSATNTYMVKQLLYVLLGIICFTLAYMYRFQQFMSRKFVIYGFIVISLLLLYAKFMTDPINGANGWIDLKVFSLQPAELCKLYLVFFVAQLLTRRENLKTTGLSGRKNWKPWALVGTLLVLVLIEPDLGGFSINAMIVIVMLCASGIDYRKALLSLTGLLLTIGIAVQLLRFWNPLKNTSYAYMYNRIVAFYNPFKVASTSGQQLINSYYAISNGGLLGLGLGNSIQKRGYLPEAHTDFILAVISEELGIIGVAFVLILLAWIVLRIYLIGVRSHSTYDSLVCYGIGTFVGVETLFNVGAVNGLLPITGVTLPFVSYGGSSMIVLSLALGVVMNISINQRRALEKQGLTVKQA
ncbi:cell division protein [Liquorilactobacillus sucicola DSM 21376 = JCM 15457]|uniref:Probable peptidoglycan glycosyltransferase FtsW n=1 Tax=Liquorilactobacillus sucicola DSM 21376 = JCM 15457 TaxID=1423806 RepID=A0A0R2DYF5_9LACO|nr:cell division protein [Liquorilactobacillus sucicola DSM 21376 = JCM 15457]